MPKGSMGRTVYSLEDDHGERNLQPSPMKRKRNDLPNLHEDMFHVNLPGCSFSLFIILFTGFYNVIYIYIWVKASGFLKHQHRVARSGGF